MKHNCENKRESQIRMKTFKNLATPLIEKKNKQTNTTNRIPNSGKIKIQFTTASLLYYVKFTPAHMHATPGP